MSKLIQLKLSRDKLKKYDELVEILGYTNTYGEYQRAIDFSIDLAVEVIKKQAEVLPGLKADKLEIFLATITKLRKQTEKADLIAEIAKSS